MKLFTPAKSSKKLKTCCSFGQKLCLEPSCGKSVSFIAELGDAAASNSGS